jgi:alpha-tubulin suppressor-like RCC1 family protein
VVTAISAGFSACARLSDGTVECWGDNTYGELGNGTTNTSSNPIPVAVSGLTGVTAIAAGYYDTCALLSNGTVECWGDNSYGELGNGSSTGPDTCSQGPCSTTPVAVSGLSGVTAISVGDYFACTLVSGGTVECWGYNAEGELGNGSSTGPDTCSQGPCSTTPVAVSGLSGVTAISAGGNSACALLSGGTVECWGGNGGGELGNGTTIDSSIPVAVSGLSGVTAVSVGSDFACALLSGGTVECWGGSSAGDLGNGPTDASTVVATPVAVSGLSGVTAISATGGYGFACALLSGGTVECWGDNEFGELGIGTTTGPDTCNSEPCSTTPVAVTDLSGATAISAGYNFACTLVSGGTVQCWGYNYEGELGNGTTTNSDTPVAVVW